jgi:hypothetical protein
MALEKDDNKFPGKVLKIFYLILKILKLDASPFGIGSIEMVNEVFGITTWRAICQLLEFLIHYIHLVFVGIKECINAFDFRFIRLTESKKHVSMLEYSTSPLI